jgi:arylsulfatase A-like enzyme
VWPLLAGAAKAEPRTIFWRTNKQLAVRAGDWKLIDAKGGEPHLFHISEDPFEKTDAAAQESERTKAMLAQFRQWKDTLPDVKKK